MNSHCALPPSPWIERWAPLLPPGGTVLDVACGAGRHVRWLHERGHRVTGVDRDAAALEPLQTLGEMVCADIEHGAWPLPGRRFDAVIVTNYLWRPLLATIVASVAPGGVMLYETFAAGNERLGRPARPDFLLQPGELLGACAGLRIVAFEDGYLDGPARCLQRVAALREEDTAAPPERRRLQPPL